VSGEEEVPKGIAAAIADVSERATALVREEIELAKTEVAQKVGRLARGAVVAVVAGVFLLTALFFFLIGCAWLLYYYLPVGVWAFFWGFFAMAGILLVLGVLAGGLAARAVKRGSPPTPDLAIEEARRIRDTVATAAPESPPMARAGATATTPAASGTGSPSSAASTGATGSVSGSTPAPYGAAAPHAPGEGGA